MKKLTKKDIIEVAFGFADEGRKKMIEASKVKEVFVDDLIDVLCHSRYSNIIFLFPTQRKEIEKIIRQKSKVLKDGKTNTYKH